MEVCSLVDDKIENCISSLESTFSESLHIQDDAEKSDHASKGHAMCNVAEEILCEVIKPNKAKLNTVCLKKSATFPIPCEEEAASVTESSSEHFAHQTYSRSISLPVSFLCYNASVSHVYAFSLHAIKLFSMSNIIRVLHHRPLRNLNLP